jgi:hypothetical protein
VNGMLDAWSGRFHRLLSSNSLVLKTTAFSGEQLCLLRRAFTHVCTEWYLMQHAP